LVCGTLAVAFGWHFGFTAAGLGMLVSLGIYLWGLPALPPDRPRRTVAAAPLEAADMRAVVALLLTCLLVSLFWAAYDQQGNTSVLWAEEFTDRSIDLAIWRGEIPTPWFLALNPLMIFLLTPILVRIWAAQAARGKEPSPVAKMAFGCVCVALGNLLMARPAAALAPGEKAAAWWLVSYFALVTLGELYLAPVGLALFSLAAPVRLRAMMMGVWFATTLPGDILAGWLGGFWSTMGKTPFYLMIAAGAGGGRAPVFAAGPGPRGAAPPRRRAPAGGRGGTRRAPGLDAGELDHLAPLVDVLGDELGELVRRVRRHRDRAEIGEALLDGRVEHRGVGVPVERRDDLGRRAPGGAKANPAGRLVALEETVDRRHLRQERKPRGCGHAQRAKLASVDVRQRGRRHVEHHLHLTGEEIGHRRGRALVGDVRQIHAGDELEQLPRDVMRAADAGRGHVQLAGIGLGVGNKLGDGLGRHRGVNLHDQRNVFDLSDWRDVGDKVETELFIERGVDRVLRVHQQQRVAIGRHAGDRFCRDVAGSARPDLDEKLLAEPVRQELGDQT